MPLVADKAAFYTNKAEALFGSGAPGLECNNLLILEEKAFAFGVLSHGKRTLLICMVRSSLRTAPFVLSMSKHAASADTYNFSPKMARNHSPRTESKSADPDENCLIMFFCQGFGVPSSKSYFLSVLINKR
jgi:hypothetical protein